jgi:hypothetical protein
MSHGHSDLCVLRWRVASGPWRWLLLGTLGASANGCGAKAEKEPSDVRHQSTSQPGAGSGGGMASSAGYGGSAGSGGSTAPTTRHDDCAAPTSLGGGWERCDSGLIHRAAVSGQCASRLPRAEPIDPAVIAALYPDYVASADAGAPGPLDPQCLSDADCTQAPHGHCIAGNYGDGATGVFCSYGCTSDADCGENSVCVCGEEIGQCYSSGCSTDADCSGKAMCASYESTPGCPSTRFECQTPEDTCVTNADCPSGQSCTVDEFGSSGVRFCTNPNWVCGRPYLVDGCALRAAAEARDDWYPNAGVPAAPAEALDRELRSAVTQGWLEQALMEHASVAAFARFSLQLLSLGAPAALVSEAARAMQDEIGHARDCFALARRHAGGELGPGVLPLDGALAEQSVEAIVLGTIAEGCIGETVAAMEAAEALEHCEDAATRPVLERIASDETRHAQLAWRFVAWALDTGSAELREQARAAFARALEGTAPAAPTHAASDFELRLLGQGLLSAGVRASLRARVLSEVIAPCAAALFRGSAAAHGRDRESESNAASVLQA